MKHISKLPEPYKTLAEHRREQRDRKPGSPIIDEVWGAFEWHASPEKHGFWDNVFCAATVDELPTIPTESMDELKGLSLAYVWGLDEGGCNELHAVQKAAKPRLYLSPQALFEYLTDKDTAIDAIGRCVVFSTPEGKALQATEAYIDSNDNIHLTIQN